MPNFDKMRSDNGEDTHDLYSTVIERSVSGHYPFPSAICLFYNEAMRREIARLDRAMDFLEPTKYLWKVIAVMRWLEEFFFPLVAHHEKNQRTFLRPRYATMGYNLPANLASLDDNFSQHESILDLIKKICDTTLNDHEQHCGPAIQALVVQLKLEMNVVRDALEEQYDIEERFWPAVFLVEGPDVYQQCLREQLAANHALPCEGLLLATCFHAVGVDRRVIIAEDGVDAPWCSPQTCEDMATFFSEATGIFPTQAWLRRYLKLKRMINCVRGDVDVLDIEANYFRIQRRASRSWSTLFFRSRSSSNSSSNMMSSGMSGMSRPTSLDRATSIVLSRRPSIVSTALSTRANSFLSVPEGNVSASNSSSLDYHDAPSDTSVYLSDRSFQANSQVQGTALNFLEHQSTAPNSTSSNTAMTHPPPHLHHLSSSVDFGQQSASPVRNFVRGLFRVFHHSSAGIAGGDVLRHHVRTLSDESTSQTSTSTTTLNNSLGTSSWAAMSADSQDGVALEDGLPMSSQAPLAPSHLQQREHQHHHIRLRDLRRRGSKVVPLTTSSSADHTTSAIPAAVPNSVKPSKAMLRTWSSYSDY